MPGKGKSKKGKKRRGKNSKKVVSAEEWFHAVSSGSIDRVKNLARDGDPNLLYRGVSALYFLARHSTGQPLSEDGFPFRVCEKYALLLQMFTFLLSLPKTDPNLLNCVLRPDSKEKKSEMEDDWVDIGEKKEGVIHALCRQKGQNSNQGCLKALVRHHKTDPNLQDSNGNTAIHITCSYGVVEHLSVLGATQEQLNFHLKDEEGVSGLEALCSINQRHYPRVLEYLGLLRKNVFRFPPLLSNSPPTTQEYTSETNEGPASWLKSLLPVSDLSLSLPLFSSCSLPEEPSPLKMSFFSTSAPYDSPHLLRAIPKLQLLDFSEISPKTFPQSILQLHPEADPDDFLIDTINFSRGDKIIYESTRGSFSLLAKFLRNLSDYCLCLAGLDLTEDDVNVILGEHPSTRFLILWKNPRLHRIPRMISSLSNLERVEMEVDTLSIFEQELIKESKPAEIRSYLNSLGRYSLEPIRERKCLVMGDTAVGKTTLVRRLRGNDQKGEIMSTDGIDLGTLELTPYKSKKDPIQLSIWDFAGQAVYHSTHQLFMTDSALYLVLFRFHESLEKIIRDVSFWVGSITARSVTTPLLLMVATQGDRVPSTKRTKKLLQIREAFKARFPLIRVHKWVWVSCTTGYSNTVRQLKGTLYHVCSSKLISVPTPVVEMRTLLSELPEAVSSFPVISIDTMEKFWVGGDEKLCVDILRALEILGSVVLLRQPLVKKNFDPHEAFTLSALSSSLSPSRSLGSSSVSSLSSYEPPPKRFSKQTFIVLRPQWLTELCAKIVTTNHTWIRHAILNHESLKFLWREFPKEHYLDMYELLLRANILYPLSSSSSETDFYQQKSLVPCMLPNTSPDLKFLWPKRRLGEEDNVVWHRRYCLNCSLPIGAMPRILTYLLSHPSFLILSRWKNGCIVRYERREKGKDIVGRIKIEKVEGLKTGDAIDVDVVWIPNGGSIAQTREVYDFIFARKNLFFSLVASLFRCLSSVFETLLSEFYHVRYLVQVEVSPGKWSTLKQLRNHQAGSSEGLEHVRLDMVAPDLYFLDLRSNKRFLIDWDELTFEEKLGQGAFGSVMGATLVRKKGEEDNQEKWEKEKEENQEDQEDQDDNDEKEEEEEDGDDDKQKEQEQEEQKEQKEHEKQEEQEEQEQKQEKSGEKVAVKILLGSIETQSEDFALFEREVWLMSLLSHQNVVRLYGVTLSPTISMVMEMLRGGDLYMSLFNTFQVYSLYGLWEKVNEVVSVHRVEVSKAEKSKISPAPLLPFEEAFKRELERFERAASALKRASHCKLPSSSPMTLPDVNEKSPTRPEIDAVLSGILQASRQLYSIDYEAFQTSETSDEEDEDSEEPEQIDERKLRSEATTLLDLVSNVIEPYSLKASAFPLSLVLKLTMDVAVGMLYLHSLNPPLIHRDLKAVNIFLTTPISPLLSSPALLSDILPTPLAKVGDFGLSVNMAGMSELRVGDQGDVKNLNPIWAAPEILRGSSYTTKSDVYGFGILMFEILARQVPFKQIYEDSTSTVTNASLFLNFVRAKKQEKGGLPLIFPPYSKLPIQSNSCAYANVIDRYIEIAQACLLDDPLLRPTFFDIYPLLWNLCSEVEPLICRDLLPPTDICSSTSPSPPSQIDVDSNTFPAPSLIVEPFSIDHPSPSSDGNPGSNSMRVNVMCGAFDSVVWLGFQNGRIAAFDGSSALPCLVHCANEDALSQCVTALAFCGTDEGTFIWSGSADGTLRVWNAGISFPNDVIESTREMGWIQDRGNIWTSPRWLELENGELRWYREYMSGSEAGSVCVKDIISFEINKEVGYGDLKYKSGGKVWCKHFGVDDSRALARWRQKILRVKDAFAKKDANGQLTWVCEKPLHSHITSLVRLHNCVWSIDGEGNVCEWTLFRAVDVTGLPVNTATLEPARRVAVDMEMVPNRSRYCGFMQTVSDKKMWVGVGPNLCEFSLCEKGLSGGEWVLDSSQTGKKVEWDKSLLTGMASFPGAVVTCDQKGMICIWDQETFELKKSIASSHHFSCLQAVGGEVWLGTMEGKIFRLDPRTYEVSISQDNSNGEITGLVEVRVLDSVSIWAGTIKGVLSVWKA